MNRLTKYLYLFHTIIMIITGAGGWLVVHHIFPQFKFNGYAIIPCFFYIMGLIFIWRFKKAPFHDSIHIVNLYILLRMINIFASFAIIVIYWIIHTSYIKNFVIVFIIFYLISIMSETIMYLKMEKYMKKELEQNKHKEEREHIE